MSAHPKKHRASFDRQEPPRSTDAARVLLQTALRLLHNNNNNNGESLGLLQALLQRCRELDALCSSSSTEEDIPSLETQLLLARTSDSGYTPLHEAVYQGDLCRILFWLRNAVGAERMTRRPMELLHLNNSSSAAAAFSKMRDLAVAVDHEGLTPAALLAVLQRRELSACRASLSRTTIVLAQQQRGQGRRSRSNSLFDELSETAAADNDEQNEFDLLARAMRRRQQQHSDDDDEDSSSAAEQSSIAETNNKATTYGCEVFTFGRAHHCALGVVASNRRHEKSTYSSSSTSGTSGGTTKSSSSHQQQLYPQRVQAFAQDTVGRAGSAVAVASATYHTLTVTASGELYAFGLGKGGRLGTGDEKPCATPVRVQGPLLKQIVVGVAAAENHSLCVTADGHVYAFGSNRFGQLGTTNSSKLNADDTTSRCLPRRVDDLKQVFCISVAAGARHSVGLSRSGEVYVWGENTAGQLGISDRSSSINNNSLHKVQRVNALWKAAHGPKIAIAISASEQSTLVLTSASGQRGLPVNSVYSWGNGYHVPCKAHFGSGSKGRAINPVAISCARYHNVVITAEGEVYSWGLHADSLGMPGRNGRSRVPSDADKCNAVASAISASLSAPTLVAGMLSENGGGKVVAVSASENHTAVVTEDGHLWTWGDTYKQNVLGHEGVRWQPEPKRVPGVHRAVSVSAAKEHTVLLIGASFPPLPFHVSTSPGSKIPSLETLAARTIAQHCDLFNVLPILITAERTQTTPLLEYCNEFVRLNCDGVLNVGEKSAMDCYLNEQLDGCSLASSGEDNHRDDRQKPFVTDVVMAGSDGRLLSFGQERLCSVDGWLRACEELSRTSLVASVIARYRITPMKDGEPSTTSRRGKRSGPRSLSISEKLPSSATPHRPIIRKDSFCSERCDELTSKMDLSSKDLAEAKLACLTKEVRAIRKRLNQIAKLENSTTNISPLTDEQQHKIERRAQLEADLLKFDPAIATVEAMLRKLCLLETKTLFEESNEELHKSSKEPVDDKPAETTGFIPTIDVIVSPTPMLRCEICQITCPDEKSHELHMNGRKHRNRMAQVAEDEQKQAAASMIEEQQRLLLLQPTTRLSPAKVLNSPWGMIDVKGSVKPKYTLPPPPHPISDTVASPLAPASLQSPATKKSLREIMEEESRQATSACKASFTPKKMPLQLPPGSAPPMKSPPWSTSKVRANDVTSSSPSPKTSVAATPQKPAYSLGDFIDKPAPKVVVSSRPSVSVGWTTPKTMPTTKEASSSVSFLDIQVQEQDFKSRQDQTYGPNGKWFIERRERAGSFKEIQGETVKETEERLFIEEQMNIEKQIYEGLAAKKAEEEKRSQKRPSKPRKKSNAVTSTNNKGKKPSENGDATKPRRRQSTRTGTKAGSKESSRDQKEPQQQPKLPAGVIG